MFALAAVILAAAAVLAQANAGRAPSRANAAETTATATPVFVPKHLRMKRLPIPTPLLATAGSLGIHLPVKPAKITIIAFHQAGAGRAVLHMRSLVSVVKSSALRRTLRSHEPTGPDESAEIAAAEDRPVPDVYGGLVIRLWRSTRTGEPDTAVDCGSKPGMTVYAPVTGRVAAVHLYSLYGQYPDYEVHIIPAGCETLDCVVLHVTSPRVTVGDEVIGGVTPIASVRKLSKWFASQLDDYTHDGGNHVHVQIERLPSPGAIKLMTSADTAGQ